MSEVNVPKMPRKVTALYLCGFQEDMDNTLREKEILQKYRAGVSERSRLVFSEKAWDADRRREKGSLRKPLYLKMYAYDSTAAQEGGSSKVSGHQQIPWRRAYTRPKTLR